MKKIALLVGCIFASFNELNCRPKKLSNKILVVKGGLGSARAIEGGSGHLPELMRTNEPFSGPVPPFVIWTVAGRSSWEE